MPVPIGQEMAEVAQRISQELVSGHTSWLPGKCLFLLVKRWRKLPKGSANNGMVTSSMPGECVRPIGRHRCIHHPIGQKMTESYVWNHPGSGGYHKNRNSMVVMILHILCNWI